MKNRFASSLALTLTLSALSSTVMADTASEVRQVVLEQNYSHESGIEPRSYASFEGWLNRVFL